jgi:hypothetical protein
MNLSASGRFLLHAIDQEEKKLQKEETEINPLVSEVATWYEKLRNAMEYQEEEVILRAAIGRILRRRLVLTKKGEPIAEPLIRELIWAKYFPENTIPKKLIDEVETKINLYLQLRELVYKKHKISHGNVDEWINQLLSSDIENVLNPSPTKEILISFIFKIFRAKVTSSEELSETKDAQVYLAIRKAFAKEDISMLRFAMFRQLYGELNEKNIEEVSEKFAEGYKEINSQLTHPLKDKVHAYIKRYMPPFFIMQHIFEDKRGEVQKLVINEEDLEASILKTCTGKYQEISKKISTAVIRSIIFILLTKAIFALVFESSFERFLYGHVNWVSIGINIASAPLLMFLTTLFISSPKKENSFQIAQLVKNVLTEENPSLIRSFHFDIKSTKYKSSFILIYGLLWLLALALGILAINMMLNVLQFSVVSKVVFVFFLALVSFMCYRISQIPKKYIVQKERQGIRSLLFDFFFVPFIQLGKTLTIGISQINIFLFIFDYLIEAPFKQMFGFIEQWFFFLRSQRESID